jgi:hypothetical protein
MRLPKGAKIVAQDGRLVVIRLAAVPTAAPTARPARVERDKLNALELARVVAEAGDRGLRPSAAIAAAQLTSSPGTRAVALALAEGWVRRRGHGALIGPDVVLPPWEQTP